MKNLLSTMIAIAMTTAAGATLAAGDTAEDIAPNAQQVIVSSAPTGPVSYGRDEAMDVAPNAQIVVEQTAYTWEEDYSQP
ncbi:MAG: hypothetical protein WCE38_06765 [Burkholderiales bacterium]